MNFIVLASNFRNKKDIWIADWLPVGFASPLSDNQLLISISGSSKSDVWRSNWDKYLSSLSLLLTTLSTEWSLCLRLLITCVLLIIWLSSWKRLQNINQNNYQTLCLRVMNFSMSLWWRKTQPFPWIRKRDSVCNKWQTKNCKH